MNPITVSIIIALDTNTAWAFWNEPDHITQWAFAGNDWECPGAENDLKIGGKFKIKMSAKDKSAGFDFVGTYTNIIPHQLIEYIMDDGRKVRVTFEPTSEGTKIMETFDPENENSPEFQREGWQAILHNFKKHVEGK